MTAEEDEDTKLARMRAKIIEGQAAQISKVKAHVETWIDEHYQDHSLNVVVMNALRAIYQSSRGEGRARIDRIAFPPGREKDQADATMRAAPTLCAARRPSAPGAGRTGLLRAHVGLLVSAY
jgi:hypothetical protein